VLQIREHALTDAPPNSLMDSTSSLEVKTTKREGVEGRSLAHNTLGRRRACWSFEIGLGKLTSNSFTHMDLHKLNNKLVSA